MVLKDTKIAKKKKKKKPKFHSLQESSIGVMYYFLNLKELCVHGETKESWLGGTLSLNSISFESNSLVLHLNRDCAERIFVCSIRIPAYFFPCRAERAPRSSYSLAMSPPLLIHFSPKPAR